MPVTNVNVPKTDAIIFPFDPIWTPEGYFRITLWRNYCAADLVNFGLPASPYPIGEVAQPAGLQVGTISQGVPLLYMGYPNATVNLNQRIITTLPIWEETAENYFAQPTINEFELGLYNTNSLADVLSVSLAGTPIAGGSVSFGSNTSGRLLNKYLMPANSPVTYFPLPQIAHYGADGSLSMRDEPGLFQSTGFTFDGTMVGYQIAVATIISDGSGTTIPSAVFTILGVVGGSTGNQIYISANQISDASGTRVWAMMAPPFDLINQNTSAFGNAGTGSGNVFTDTNSNGGACFTSSMVNQKILINFQEYDITGWNSNTSINVARTSDGANPPAGPAYWQVIVETIGSFTTPLFAQVEFQQTGSTAWSTWMIGQATPAVAGEDKRWYHANNDNPILDERLNAPLDAEQIWDLKFSHAITSGLGQLSITPATVIGDPSTYFYMPWAIGGSQQLPIRGSTMSPPITIGTLPSCGQATFTTSNTVSGVWAAHIDWNYALTLMCDAALGAGNYTITSDDSPIELEGAILNGNNASGAYAPFKLMYGSTNSSWIKQREIIPPNWTSFDADEVIRSSIYGNHKVNFAAQDQYFLPQSLWGLQTQVQGMTDDSPRLTVPRTTCWPDYLLSCWDVIMEVSLCNGFIPILSYDATTGLPNLHFQDRTKINSAFSGPTPVSAKPETMLETEMGIQVTALESFLNPRTTDGWCDDLYAMKQGHGANSWFGTYDISEVLETTDSTQDDTVNPRMANPYTVPGTPSKPTGIKTLLRYAGYTGAWFTSSYWWGIAPDAQILGMGVLTGPLANPYMGFLSNFLNVGCFWPTLVPLIPSTFVDSISPILPTTWTNALSPPYPTFLNFTPVVRARFSYTDANGNPAISYCDSLRQALARFYSMIFVQSGNKYTLEDGTLTQFWSIAQDAATATANGVTIGDRYGEPSWNNIALFNTRLMPDGNSYWCKSIKRDPNTMMTESTYLQMGNKQFVGFFDGLEGVGPLSPGSPPSGGGPPPSNPATP